MQRRRRMCRAGGHLQLTFEDILRAYVALEQGLNFNRLRMPGNADRMSDDLIVHAIGNYTGYDINVFEFDLYEQEVEKDIGRARDLYSKVHIFERDTLYAEIVLNSHKFSDGTDLVNYCWTRFCVVKEACQVFIRHYFKDHHWDYPDTASLQQIDTLFKNLVRFKFSMEDFDNGQYPPDTKVENAAEIIAILLLYPIENMAADRKDLGAQLDRSAFSLDTNKLAEKRKVPERYVDLFLTSENFDRIHAKVIKLRES